MNINQMLNHEMSGPEVVYVYTSIVLNEDGIQDHAMAVNKQDPEAYDLLEQFWEEGQGYVFDLFKNKEDFFKKAIDALDNKKEKIEMSYMDFGQDAVYISIERKELTFPL